MRHLEWLSAALERVGAKWDEVCDRAWGAVERWQTWRRLERQRKRAERARGVR